MLFKPVGIDRKGKINGFPKVGTKACQDEIVLVKTLYLSPSQKSGGLGRYPWVLVDPSISVDMQRY